MPRIPARSTREVEQLLAHHGLRRVRRGKHDHWGPGSYGQDVAVPRGRGPGQMPPGTVRDILNKAGISVAEARAFWGLTP